MDKTSLRNQRISDLVEQANEVAQVLYHFGIYFYEHTDHTLEQVCYLRGLRIDQLEYELLLPRTPFYEKDISLFSYPIDLVLEYLKHAHFLFVKNTLPYIGNLVENFKANHADYGQVERDLKILFPLFMEDFIHHIYQEEDSLFEYIHSLQNALKNRYHPSRLYYQMEQYSLQQCAIDHQNHDDEMEGIRKITKDYLLTPNAPLHVKVIYSELQQFEKSLQLHAKIENEILFPKALALEDQVRVLFAEKIKQN